MFDKAMLIERLTHSLNYPSDGAQFVADSFARASAPVRLALQQWLTDGSIPTLEIEGYTVQRLASDHRMTVPAALLTLDALSRTPEETLKTLRRGSERLNFGKK